MITRRNGICRCFRALTVTGLVLGTAGVVLWSRYERTVPLKEVVSNSGYCSQRSVRVRGRVGRRLTILGIGGYELSDGETTAYVFTEQGAPSCGEFVVVTGVSVTLYQGPSFPAVGLPEDVALIEQSAVRRDWLVEAVEWLRGC
jgi:hypothetical protein